MKTFDEKAAGKIRFNYWIYLLTCLIVVGVPTYFMSRDSATQTFSISNMIFRLVQILAFSSLGWLIGKRYNLNYASICCLAFLGYSTIFIISVLEVLFYDELSVGILGEMGFLIVGGVFSSLMFALIVFIISYPLQLLFSKKYRK